MHKTAWPPFSEMNASMEPTGDPATDIAMDSNLYDSFVPGKSTTPEAEVPMGVEEGVIFPAKDIYSDLEDSEYEALERLSEKFLGLLDKESTILGVGKQTNKGASLLLKRGHNLINLSKKTADDVNIYKFHQEYGNPMFHTFRNKFDGFYITSAPKENNSLEIVLNNISNYLRPLSCGLIISEKSQNISSIINKLGFTIVDHHIGAIGKYLITRNNLDKTAIVRYYGKKDNHDASVIFKCDIAKTQREKIDGLQVYSKLGKEAGLLFPYDRPTDVYYHMGSVSYPIDIIFINKDFKIKKICRNIQPGSLNVYGCSGVKYVLEISGGLSDSLGIKESNHIYINKGTTFDKDLLKIANIAEKIGVNKCIFKKSNLLNSGFYNILNNKIYVINSDEECSATRIIKKANLNIEPTNKVVAFDIDKLFLDDKFKVKLYKHKAPDENDRIFRGLYNEVFSIDKSSFIEVGLSDIVTKGFYENINSKYSMIPSREILSKIFNCESRNKALNKIIKTANNSKESIVFISKNDNDKLIIESLLEKEIDLKMGKKISISSDLIRVPYKFGTKDIFAALDEKYDGKNIELYSYSLVKSSGIPVPDDIKNKGKHALRHFNRSQDMCETLIDNFNKNLFEYEKIQGDQGAITNSKGEYNQSSKRNSRIVKRMLINIKDGIKILNEIKDVSTTSEIISAVADSAKNTSEAIKEVFDLINIIESDDFINQCTQKTQVSEGYLNDMKTVLSRAKEYINLNILGILILAE